ncbi:MAG: hypothetical protein U0556_18580 [Dehalococcoidia bacterium]
MSLVFLDLIHQQDNGLACPRERERVLTKLILLLEVAMRTGARHQEHIFP